ncbi:amino acid permease, partial [Klebsiella pneumoniae]|uniref:amino acid permease n=1 Tax=Klebsiella pneumoniae TaxID=573 RepID=UPI0037BE656B
VLRAIVGEWGATVIIVGSIISVLGALLAWVLLCAEVLYAAAGDGTMPAFLGRENARGVPANALWLSNGLIQLFLLLVLVNSGSYTGGLDEPGALLPVHRVRRAAGVARGRLCG